MSLLFYTDKNNSAILHPEVVKLMPSLSILTEREVLYLVLYADYNSPYRQHPPHSRKVKAMLHAFGDNEYDIVDSDKMNIAVQDYIALQYSPKVEAVDKYQAKVNELMNQLQEETSPSGIKKIDEAIDICRKRIRMLEQEYEVDMQKQGVVKGKMELSYLEKLMANSKQYKNVITQEVKLK